MNTHVANKCSSERGPQPGEVIDDVRELKRRMEEMRIPEGTKGKYTTQLERMEADGIDTTEMRRLYEEHKKKQEERKQKIEESAEQEMLEILQQKRKEREEL